MPADQTTRTAEHEADYASYARTAWPTLVRSAVFLGCTTHEAEDLAQTTLVRCYTAWPQVAAADNRSAYVYRMLINCLRDSKRRRWWGEQATDRLPEATSDDPTTDVDTADAVHRALAGLTKAHRDVVVLRYFTGLSEAQTASVLDCPAGTVKSRLARALNQLAADEHLSELKDVRL